MRLSEGRSHSPSAQHRQEGGARRRIAFVGQPEYFRFSYERDFDNQYDVFELPVKMTFVERDYADLLTFDADYNFFFRGEFVPDSILAQLHGQCIALSSEPFPRMIDGRWHYTRDSFVRYLWFRDIRSKPFDYVFHYDAASIPFFRRDGLSLSGVFPFPVATGTYHPRRLPIARDIFFIGRSTAHRERFFGPLKHHYNFLHICHGVWGPPLVRYLSSSRISLNIHAERESSWEPRLQMMLACGAFVISERITPNSYLVPGVDYVEVGDPKELVAAVDHYMNDDVARLRIAASGLKRVTSILDALPAYEAIIKGIDAHRLPRFSPSRGSSAVDALARTYRTWSRLRSRVS